MNYKLVIACTLVTIMSQSNCADNAPQRRLNAIANHLDPQHCPNCRVTEENVNDVMDRFGNTRAHLAAEQGDGEKIQLLASLKADLSRTNLLGYTPVHVAAQSRKGLSALAALVSAHADLMKSTSDKNTALHLAAGASDDQAQDRALALINAGAPLDGANSAGQTPFLLATENGAKKQRLLERLFAENVATNARNIFDGATALHAAAFEGNEWLVKCLLEVRLKADQNSLPAVCPTDAAQTNGFTPLHYACRQGHELIARLLLFHGTDPMRSSAQWQSLMCNPAMKLTPLHCAAASGSLSLVKMIYNLAPRTVHSRTSEGKKPAACADNQEVRDFLEAEEQKVIPFIPQCDIEADGTPRARL